MANVSTNGIRGCAAEINSVISITSSTTNKIQTACNEISNATSLLNGYNGAIVKGTREDKIVENSDGYKIKQTYAQHWKISGLDNTDNISTLSNLANEVSSIISTVKSQVSDIDGIASAIDSYINSVDTQLSETAITSDMLSAAYLAIGKDGVTKANLATSGEDINNRNFINYSDIKDNGLANTKLSFVLQNDGSYKVYSNGKETEFYTTGLAAAFYQKSLKRAYDNVYSSTKSESGKSSDNSAEFKDDSNVVIDKDIKESVKKEIAKYSIILTSSRASEADKKQAYNNLSAEAKSIVDGKNKILSTEETTQNTVTQIKSKPYSNNSKALEYGFSKNSSNTITTVETKSDFSYIVDNKQDIVIPKGKNLYINGNKIIGDDYTLGYDSNSAKYRVVRSDGKFAYGGYDCSELTNIEIK